MEKININSLVNELNLEIIAGTAGLTREIESKMLSRPGLELAGLTDFYEDDRIQVIGSKELAFFNGLAASAQNSRSEFLFKGQTPCFIFSNNFTVPQVFITHAENYQIPILRSQKDTTMLLNDITSYLAEELAESTNMHGVLVDVHGIGVLIRGKSGIGKSEAALELVNRGHKLIADDNIIIYEKEIGKLVGKPPKLLEKYIEIRGIGIINIVSMFGAGSFRHKKRISLVIDLDLADYDKDYDRLGLEDAKIKIINTEVSYIKIPIRPGRNMAAIIEVAALNHRLRYMGINTAQEFIQNLNAYMTQEN
jgi:HPr kinase/phosphorylase